MCPLKSAILNKLQSTGCNQHCNYIINVLKKYNS